MKRFYRFLLLMLFCHYSLSSCTEKPLEPGDQVDVHIIMGQSNSLGVAQAYQLPKELRAPLDSCYIFNKASGQFEFIEAGVNTQSEEGMFGPVVKAAQLLRDYKKKEVYFVVVGYGNSQLYNSNSKDVKDWHPDSDELLPLSKKEIEKARTALQKMGKSPNFKSISWWQGEADATYSEKAKMYEQNEAALFAALDNIAYLKNTKRVVFQVFPDVQELPYGTTVNSAKAKRASSDPRTISVIETRSYERIPQDRLHATAEGQLKAGTDLFHAIKNL